MPMVEKPPTLQETDNVYDVMMSLPVKDRQRIWYLGGKHSKERSKTYPGIAKAMAEQWAGVETYHSEDELMNFILG